MRIRIECVARSDGRDPHERIHGVGGRNGDGMRWRLTEAAVIARIEGGWDFFVERPVGHTIRVVVATRQGQKYLRTEADGEQPDNLLSLPECP